MSTPGHVFAGIPAFCLGLALLCAAGADATALKVRLLDRDGKPLAEAVVTAQPGPGVPPPTAPRVKNAVMDQVKMKFVPHILVIQTGTSVTFPNSDTVAHQVYSFSAPKRFQLPLYHGKVPSPQVFDEPGLVVLGCNIHDSMIGYIYVAPTPYFGQTDATGTLTLTDLPAGEYELSLWHPRLNEPQIKRTVSVGGDSPAALEVRLAKALRPEVNTDSSSHGY